MTLHLKYVESLPEAGCGRSIDLGFAKTVGKRGRHGTWKINLSKVSLSSSEPTKIMEFNFVCEYDGEMVIYYGRAYGDRM